MANLNKVSLIGRLTRKPEAVANGAGAKFGFAVNNRKKNSQTGQYEDVPVWIDCVIWDRGENKQAARVVSTLDKGAQIYIDGHLQLEEWEDKNGGGKRSKLTVVVDSFQYLDAKQDGGQQPAPRQQQPRQSPMPTSNWGHGQDDPFAPSSPPRPPGSQHGDDTNDIPFSWLMPLLVSAAGLASLFV